ncbi:MAG: aminopeptidase P N-terminal domain-containing protein [Planctomycetota bacterium]
MDSMMHLVTWFGALVLPASSPADELAARRARAAAELGNNAMLIVFAAEPKNRTGDSDYPYRQDSNYLYLTGLDQPGATLVIMPGNPTRRDLLFLPARGPHARRGPAT